MEPRCTSTVATRIALVVLATAACGATSTVSVAPPMPPAPEPIAELWVDPGDTPRDLFWGPGGREHAPADVTYTFEAKDETGFSTSYDVTGPDGLEWSVKIGPEAQTEVAVSRLLWGLGYHQPPTYYMPSWTLDGEAMEPHQESAGRFRPKLSGLVREDEWRWLDNPFSGARELKGLLVVLLMLNSTDLKDSNNSVYRVSEPWPAPPRWFVVRDLGAALGETGRFYPRRNWLEGFEKQAFITKISGENVTFDYDGAHGELLRMITPADVRWAAERVSRLTDTQWKDAFRAAGYTEPIANRFIVRIRQKADDGLALRARDRAAGAGAR
jgi:hypothetical protein